MVKMFVAYIFNVGDSVIDNWTVITLNCGAFSLIEKIN